MEYRKYKGYDEEALVSVVKEELPYLKKVFKSAVDYYNLKENESIQPDEVFKYFANDCLYVAGYIIGADKKIRDREIEMGNELFKGYVGVDPFFPVRITDEMMRTNIPHIKKEVEKEEWVLNTVWFILYTEMAMKKELPEITDTMNHLIGDILLVAILIAGADGSRKPCEKAAIDTFIGNSIHYVGETLSYPFDLDDETLTFLGNTFLSIPFRL